MRYADGPTVEVEAYIGVPPSVVWKLVSDIHTPTRFSDELLQVRWIGDRQFVGRNRHALIGEWETTCTVVAHEPDRVFGWAVGDPDNPSALWRFTLEPAGGGTVLRHCVRLGPAPSGLTRVIEARPDDEERIVARRMEEHRANMRATVEGIKALAERPEP